VRYEHPLIASLLIGVAQEADLVSPGFEQSTAISNHSTLNLDFTLHYGEQRIVLPGDASWKRLCSSSVPPDDDDDNGICMCTVPILNGVSICTTDIRKCRGTRDVNKATGSKAKARALFLKATSAQPQGQAKALTNKAKAVKARSRSRIASPGGTAMTDGRKEVKRSECGSDRCWSGEKPVEVGGRLVKRTLQLGTAAGQLVVDRLQPGN